MKFPVSPQKEESLLKQMEKWGLRESDLDEQFIRSGGHGGQNVNKLSTCVVLTHRPTGLQVKCQRERSQALNRFFARRLLLDKMEKHLYGIHLAQEKEKHKIRKQKKRRSRRTKLKMLEDKSHRKGKKEMRLDVKQEF
ncbi:MAG: peptide chain release factor-like protein [Chlamydiae bacterium]|nr:peptide chain release factor-like protein [Chlamydiota bacterium]MBI3265570.1 peptide chain release factor-like protein [Chlamydiota bacterium]